MSTVDGSDETGSHHVGVTRTSWPILRVVGRFLALWLVDAVSLMVTAAVLPGVTLEKVGSMPVIVVALVAAAVLGAVNLLIRPLVLLLARP